MKAKYLFFSLALASAFTACTQEEMFDAPALDSNKVANRPVAGIVTFVNDEANSRYNRQKAWFEDGDKMGLYLMDEFTGQGENFDANETPWKYQSCWWTMYNMVDYINTNYGYVYDAKTEEWINRASQLSEGNYIAMFPQNTRATNRQNLWHAIDANVDLVDHTTKPRFYVNRDNQFFIGYEQILRDQEAGESTGELRADITMKPIMTYQVIELVNGSNFNFKPKKVVFKAHAGKLLPNVAYINPKDDAVKATLDGYTAPWWAFVNGKATDFMKANPLKDNCGDVLAKGNYDRETFNQAAARGLVEYGSTTDGIPYGMTEAEAVPTYEYVFNFPADADILYGGIEAAANGGVTATKSTISIALPMFEGWEKMEMVVYGEMQTSDDTYRPGILKKRTDVDNGKFNYDLREWNESMGANYPTSTVEFDENYFYQQEEIRVSTTEDLVNLLTARLSANNTNKSLIEFNVQVYGNGVEITDEVVKLITDYEKENTNVDVKVKFNNVDRVETPLIFKTDAIDMFEYVGMYVDVEAPQTITGEVANIIDLNNYSTITVTTVDSENPATLTAVKIVNEADATISANNATIAAEKVIENHGTINLSATTVNGEILNEAVVNAEGATLVASIINYNQCLNCGNGQATLTVKSGVLTVVSYLDNKDNVLVEEGAKLVSKILNDGTIEVKGNVTVQEKSENKGTINIAATGEVRVETPAVLANTGTINVNGELMENIQNAGLINVIENGHVIVNGKIDGSSKNGIIDVTLAADTTEAHAAKDKAATKNCNYFRYTVSDETTSTALEASLKARISSANWGVDKNPVILVWGANSASSYYGTMAEANVERIIVENDLVIAKSEEITLTKFNQLNDYDWTNAKEVLNTPSKNALWVKASASLTVANGVTFEVSEEGAGGTDGMLHVYIAGKFMAKNHSTVNTKNVTVEGTGTVEIDTDVDYFNWSKSNTAWTGNWDGE